MRFRDAAHVDLGSFYARRPSLGRIYRLAGYAACVAVLVYASDPKRIAGLLVVLLVAWAMAWKREVGALWRSSLVAAIVMCAAIITCDRFGHPLVAPAAAPAAAPADGGRVYELLPDGTLREKAK